MHDCTKCSHQILNQKVQVDLEWLLGDEEWQAQVDNYEGMA